jgi:outer membrane immunogenic protein
MKKLIAAGVIVLGATLSPALAGSAPPYSWTGFYLSGGGGYGWWNAKNEELPPFQGTTARSNGNGWFGTVGGGYDWQLAAPWIAGVFADAQFGDNKGAILAPFQLYSGKIENNVSFAAGLRVGYLVAPDTLLYANGGYSHAHFTGSYWFDTFLVPLSVKSQQRDGWFIGGGLEHAFTAAPGWSAKIEYRFAEYGRKGVGWFYENSPLPYPGGNSFDVAVQTVSLSLVYRFK